MADHLTPFVEFLGLPGSGKSYYSHKVAEKLRKEGYKILEPSWELDHTTGKYARAVKKLMMAWLFTLCNRREAMGIKDVIRRCGVSISEEKRYRRNILYKAYFLSKRKEKVLFFDEGFAQMAVSLAVSSEKKAGQIYEEILSVLKLELNGLLVRIDCNIETALLNMDMRLSHDSYVERLSGLDAKKGYLNKYKIGCETISSHSLTVKYDQDDSKVVTTIVNCLKIQLEK